MQRLLRRDGQLGPQIEGTQDLSSFRGFFRRARDPFLLSDVPEAGENGQNLAAVRVPTLAPKDIHRLQLR